MYAIYIPKVEYAELRKCISYMLYPNPIAKLGSSRKIYACMDGRVQIR